MGEGSLLPTPTGTPAANGPPGATAEASLAWPTPCRDRDPPSSITKPCCLPGLSPTPLPSASSVAEDEPQALHAGWAQHL